jgi:hypothetical protein
MIPLMDLLTDEGREDLIRGKEVTLVNIEVQCPPGAKNPGGLFGNCEPCIITSAFRDGEGWPAEMLSKIRTICEAAPDDFCDIRHPMMDEEQWAQARAMAKFRSHETVARFLPYIMAGVSVWELSVFAWMEDREGFVTNGVLGQ